MSISLSGLSSTLDTNGMVDQLMAIERIPEGRLKMREQAVQARQAALQEVATRLRSLASAAADLRSVATWSDTQTATSSDATRIDARRTGGAAAGGYQVQVNQLARAEQRTYAYTAPGSAAQIDVNGVTVDVAAGATLDDVVATINGRSDSPVYATAVNGQLVLSGRKTGAANGITASSTTLVQDAAQAKAALDASYTVDGVAKTSATNVVTDGIVGLELTLKGAGAGAVTVNVGAPGPDTEGIKGKVQSLVDTYNSTVAFVRAKLNEHPVHDPTSNADAAKGVLYGDSMLNGLLTQLRTSFTQAVAGNPATLDDMAEIGVSTGATTGGGTISSSAVAGTLVLDGAKLADALTKDPASVRRLLAGDDTVDGFAARFNGLIDPVSRTGGLIDGRIDGATSELKSVQDAIAQMDQRLSLRETALRAKFTAMETALSQVKSQGSWLSGQLAALPQGA
jgi:flagellar hook-associated protein 2